MFGSNLKLGCHRLFTADARVTGELATARTNVYMCLFIQEIS
jgi:hypothetical protein